MWARQLTPSRSILAIAGLIAVVLLAGCGRVDLEDLTPEAFKTQEALDLQNQPTSVPTTPADPNASPDSNQTTTSGGGGGGAPEGDTAAGASIYNATCSGCHEGGRAASILGTVFDPAVEIPKLRTGEGFGVPHPKYTPTDIRPLNDNDFNDVFAYLASQ
ncbi:MAG: cytochrome c [Chloroflexota bacterium]|nr:cytochrome c [Chloroflexota bacterium]